jgi:hypothetical protein
VKTAAFTVRATLEQSVRWKRAADAEGHRSAGTWLAAAADAYLKVRAKAGLPIPLAWRRLGHFAVKLGNGETVTVRGQVSPPFGAFRGDERGPRTSGGPYSLVYIPEGRIIALLHSSGQCKALASELAPILIRGEPLLDPSAVIERHRRDSV